jgi:hypothetical protein
MRTGWQLPLYLLLNGLALILTGLALVAANAEFQSTARDALTGLVFGLAAACLAAAFWLARQKRDGKGRVEQLWSRVAPALSLVFALAWGLAWLPASKSGAYYYYFIGLQPLFGWLTFASGLGALFGMSLRPEFSIRDGLAYWRNRPVILRVGAAALAFFSLTAGLIASLRIWENREPYWYGAGVPLLGWQAGLVLLAALWASRLPWARWRQAKHIDVVAFFVIWGLSALFWVSQPLQSSFFFTPPLFPNHEFYPFADLETFDRASQYALIGQGINNGQFFDRTLYIAFLVYLHTFFGQNYETLMNIQAGLFAIFPALVYLLGKKLHSRGAGLVAAALAAWRGVNALAGMALLDTATAKHLLTDFPTALGLAVFGIFMLDWLKNPRQAWHKAALAAGTLGLTSLLRPHVLLLLVVFLPLVALAAKPDWRRGLATAGLALLAFLAGVVPWAFFSGSDTSLLDLYATRIRNVIENRYAPPQPEPMPDQPAKPALLVISRQPYQERIRLPFPVSHFLNNLQTAALSLPIAPQMLSLRETVKGGESIWQILWTGELSAQGTLMLSLGLAITALGLGAAAQKSARMGAALPVVFFLYAAANSLARTSGGRYIVPIDWMVILFFGLGLAALLEAGQAFLKRPTGAGESVARQTAKTGWRVKALGVVACFGLLGGLIPFSQTIHSPRYAALTTNELVERLMPALAETQVERPEVERFFRYPSSVILQGRALYPRFFGQGQGFQSWEPYNPVEYPRMVLVLIGPEPLHADVVLAGPSQAIRHGSDVIVLGCREQSGPNIIRALLVALPEEGITYFTEPGRPLGCPFPPPSCDNNKYCR